VLKDTPKYVMILAGGQALDFDSTKPMSNNNWPSVANESSA
jgi:hypothetical protein